MKHMRRFASIKRRFSAFLIDFLFIHITSYSILGIFKFERDYSGLFLTAFLFSFMYFLIMWRFLNGKSLGALLLKLRICSEDLSPVKLKQIIWRSFDKSIFIAPASLLIIWVLINIYLSIRLLKTESFGERRQVLWDVHSKTVVLYD